eukprot:TRINITY_DN67540_c0_g1_i1.p1 TRINITY_DN67540_c0_g1~~TRINITY_DN67540_c0_g1_i1.p1  ORF type:complete len:249 (+),score=26.59 TRINITY_DN67540_c0_g1_i1:73-819(+)
MARVLKAPVVNFLDMPEAMLGRGGPLSRQMSYRNNRATFRVKSLALPIVSENDTKPQDAIPIADDVEQSWSCVGCTFINSGWFPRCEMCETLRDRAVGTAHTSHPASETTSFTIQDQDRWPSLQESAQVDAACEVASVASSWLEVDDVRIEDADDDDVLFVSVGEMPDEQHSWASRAKMVAGCGPAASLPASGVTIPPVHRPKTSTKSKVHESDINEDDFEDLSLLEDRRLYPQFDRTMRQRRGSANR